MEDIRNSDGGGSADYRPADDGGHFVEPGTSTTTTRSSFTEAQSQSPNMQWFPVGPSYHQCLITLESRELSHKVNICNMIRMPTDIALKCKVLNDHWHYQVCKSY